MANSFPQTLFNPATRELYSQVFSSNRIEGKDQINRHELELIPFFIRWKYFKSKSEPENCLTHDSLKNLEEIYNKILKLDKLEELFYFSNDDLAVQYFEKIKEFHEFENNLNPLHAKLLKNKEKAGFSVFSQNEMPHLANQTDPLPLYSFSQEIKSQCVYLIDNSIPTLIKNLEIYRIYLIIFERGASNTINAFINQKGNNLKEFTFEDIKILNRKVALHSLEKGQTLNLPGKFPIILQTKNSQNIEISISLPKNSQEILEILENPLQNILNNKFRIRKIDLLEAFSKHPQHFPQNTLSLLQQKFQETLELEKNLLFKISSKFTFPLIEENWQNASFLCENCQCELIVYYCVFLVQGKYEAFCLLCSSSFRNTILIKKSQNEAKIRNLILNSSYQIFKKKQDFESLTHFFEKGFKGEQLQEREECIKEPNSFIANETLERTFTVIYSSTKKPIFRVKNDLMPHQNLSFVSLATSLLQKLEIMNAAKLMNESQSHQLQGIVSRLQSEFAKARKGDLDEFLVGLDSLENKCNFPPVLSFLKNLRNLLFEE